MTTKKKKNNRGEKKEGRKKRGENSISQLDWKNLYLSIKEVRESIRETREAVNNLRRSIDELRERQEKTDEQIRELRDSQKETDRQIRELKNQVAGVVGGWRRFVEGMVEPAAISYFRKKGFVPYEVHQRLKVSKNGRNAEYDLLLVCHPKKTVMLISAKTYATSSDVRELLEDIENLGFFLDKLKGYRVIGATAGVSFGGGADRFALRNGLVVFIVSEDSFSVSEPQKIKFFEI